MIKPKFKVGDKAVYSSKHKTVYFVVSSIKIEKKSWDVWYYSLNSSYKIKLRHPTQEEIDLYYNK